MIELTYNLKEINTVAKQVLSHFKTKVILFNGAMGAGKTTFINALLTAMQSEDTAKSPTFSIVNEYHTPNDKVYHFDCYRIESHEDALDFGIEDYLYSSHWIFIEWPSRIASLLPEHSVYLTISATNDPTVRKLTITNP